MDAVDYETLAYQKLWALLEAPGGSLVTEGSAVYVAPGRRIKWDRDDRVVQRKPAKAHGDFRELEVQPASDFADTLYTQAERYAYQPTFNPAAGPGWTQRQEFVFPIILTHRDQRIGLNNPFELAVRQAILAGGPRWGVPWVQRVGPLSATRQQGVSDTTAGSARAQTIMRLPVVVVFNGQTQFT